MNTYCLHIAALGNRPQYPREVVARDLAHVETLLSLGHVALSAFETVTRIELVAT